MELLLHEGFTLDYTPILPHVKTVCAPDSFSYARKMDALKKYYTNTSSLHHAYVIPGDLEMVIAAVRDFADSTLNIGAGNPDYYERIFESFGIDEARELKETAYLAPIGDRRIFILGIPSITREAQNALLKLLEEPPENIHFFLVVSTEEALLPTVRSRTELLRIETEGEHADAESFLRDSPEKRLETVKKILDKKDKALAAAFLRSLETVIAESGAEKGSQRQKMIEPVLFAETYIRDPGSSAKLLLEYVSLELPVLKKGTNQGNFA